MLILFIPDSFHRNNRKLCTTIFTVLSHFLTWISPLIIITILIFNLDSIIFQQGAGCWIKKENVELRFLCYYFWVAFIWCLNTLTFSLCLIRIMHLKFQSVKHISFSILLYGFFFVSIGTLEVVKRVIRNFSPEFDYEMLNVFIIFVTQSTAFWIGIVFFYTEKIFFNVVSLLKRRSSILSVNNSEHVSIRKGAKSLSIFRSTLAAENSETSSWSDNKSGFNSEEEEEGEEKTSLNSRFLKYGQDMETD
jgi:hypothetical protein